MKKLLSSKFFLPMVATYAVLLTALVLIYLTVFQRGALIQNPKPAKEPIPLGFTWVDEKTEGFTLEELDLRVMYTTDLTTVENPEVGGDPWMIYGGSWYYRTTPGNLFKVVVVQGQEVIASFDNIMSVSNDAQFCTEDQQPCRSGRVWLLTVGLEPIYVETTAQQYVVINP